MTSLWKRQAAGWLARGAATFLSLRPGFHPGKPGTHGRANPLQPQKYPVRKNSPFAIIWIFAAIVVCLLILADFSLGLLSSMRAYVGGESLWSKSQKDAVFHLQQYASSAVPEELGRFRVEIDVLMGDRKSVV